jgi:oxygen-independent coproporphyrinogen-3 oxidase
VRQFSLERATDTAQQEPPRALYVHIPFCKSRCFYCDFTTYVAPKEAVANYLNQLVREFDLLAPLAADPLETVYFGGGTPTLLTAAQWRWLMRELRQRFVIAPRAEITVEANPGTVDAEKLAALLEAGVNRISFGAQSFNDRLLLAIGRLHDADAVRHSIALARAAGFERINVDLMFGLPEQSLGDVQESVQQLMELGVRHVSAYWLKVEPGTPFAEWQAQGALPLPGEDEEAAMYEEVRQALTTHGLVHYEVSNFAEPGEESRHNLVYWRNEPYLAAGVGAHGYVGDVRYENVRSLADYADRIGRGLRPVEAEARVSVAESLENTMMLGLRLREGVSRERFLARHGVEMTDAFGDVIDRLVKRRLLEWADDHVRLTEAAWPIANAVFAEFVGALVN